MALMYAVPSVHTDLAGIDWQSSRAARQSKGSIQGCGAGRGQSPNLRTADFVRRLIACRFALKKDWQQRA
ncbi:MAG TPA: hypothetical protein VKI17_06715 [Gemmataceae bacterium]|nr:hypothetical protein [Gemmataceae bacterium]